MLQHKRIKWSKATHVRCHEGAVIASCSIFELSGEVVKRELCYIILSTMSCSQLYGRRGTLLSTPTSRTSAIGECSNSTSSASEISSSGIPGFTLVSRRSNQT